MVAKAGAGSTSSAVGSVRQLRTWLRAEIEDPLALYLVEQGERDLRVVLGEDSIEFEQTERSAPPQILA